MTTMNILGDRPPTAQDLPRAGRLARAPRALRDPPRPFAVGRSGDLRSGPLHPERSAGRHRMAYYPFSDGPRGCIGKAFSMMEATLIVAMVARRFRLEIDRERPVEIQPSLTLRPKNGLWMTLRPASPRGPAP